MIFFVPFYGMRGIVVAIRMGKRFEKFERVHVEESSAQQGGPRGGGKHFFEDRVSGCDAWGNSPQQPSTSLSGPLNGERKAQCVLFQMLRNAVV